MAILDLDDSNKTPAETVVEVNDNRKLYTKGDFKTSTLFNKDHALDTLVNFVDGAKWSIDYFVQIRDINDTLHLPDVNVPATLLKYNRINNLIIYLEGGIDNTNPTDITGAGKINAGFLPNYGDAFKASLPGGREALFYLTEVTKERYNLHEIYNVKFKLYSFLDSNDDALYRDLIFKTQKEYTYNKTFIEDKSAPVILNKDYDNKLELAKTKQDIIDYYFKVMVNDNKNMVSVPTKTGSYLDKFINNFIFKLVDSNEVRNISNISRLDYSSEINYTVLDALINRDKSMIKLATKDIGYKGVVANGSYATDRSLIYLNINYVADKVDNSTRVTIDVIDNLYTRDANYTDNTSNISTNYIFGDSFYNLDRADCNLFEKCIIDYLNGSLVAMSDLKILTDSYMYWDVIDQFYKLPILLLLIQDQINNTFSPI